jgi:lipid II:glycine glycyltransferase (peptidoglycan interpeptide bridge formation enzyme)
MIESKFHVEVDNVTADNWDILLEYFQDSTLYQTWAYGVVRWGRRNLSHLVLRYDDKVVGIAQLRIIRRGALPGGIAYIRWGPLFHRHDTNLEQETVNQMATALYNEYVVKRRLFLRMLPGAFVGSERAKFLESGFYRLFKVRPGFLNIERTLLLDLSPTLVELRKRLDQKWRNQLNRAEKNDLQIRIGNGIADYEIFARLYREMWNRKRFETSVNIDEFSRICDVLPANLKLRIILCYAGEDAVSGIVCSAMGDKGIYILGATTEAGLKSKGAYLLQWSMIRWLKDNGFRYYDLGGIDPEHNPGVYHFKCGLSGQDVTRLPPLESCEHLLSGLYMKFADIVSRRPRLLPLSKMRRAGLTIFN